MPDNIHSKTQKKGPRIVYRDAWGWWSMSVASHFAKGEIEAGREEVTYPKLHQNATQVLFLMPPSFQCVGFSSLFFSNPLSCFHPIRHWGCSGSSWLSPGRTAGQESPFPRPPETCQSPQALSCLQDGSRWLGPRVPAPLNSGTVELAFLQGLFSEQKEESHATDVKWLLHNSSILLSIVQITPEHMDWISLHLFRNVISHCHGGRLPLGPDTQNTWKSRLPVPGTS